MHLNMHLSSKRENHLKIAQLYCHTFVKNLDTDDHQNGSIKSIKQMFCEKNSVQSKRKQQEHLNCNVTFNHTITSYEMFHQFGPNLCSCIQMKSRQMQNRNCYTNALVRKQTRYLNGDRKHFFGNWDDEIDIVAWCWLSSQGFDINEDNH